MRSHLLRVDRPVVEFDRLIAAVRQGGGRVGWLEWSAAPAAPEPLPPGLAAAAERGVLRAVAVSGDHAVSGGLSVAVKPMRGAPVLRDVLREHFRGCLLVLVRGRVAAPLLEPAGVGWTVAADGGPPRSWTTAALVAALAKPHPPFCSR